MIEIAPLVAAFSDSPRLRETLRVLLQHDCELRFLPVDAPVSLDSTPPDLAVVATHPRVLLLHTLRSRWPTLPIVAVDVADGGDTPDPGVRTVPMEPDAIRTAVIQELGGRPGVALRIPVQRIAEPLRAELAYAFATLRSHSALLAAHAGPDTFALLNAVMKVQTDIIAEDLQHLERFQTRPRATDMSPTFSAALCRQIAQRDARTTGRAILCVCTIDTSLPHRQGPVALVPITATLVRAHLARRADAPVASARATADGVFISYSPRHAPTPPVASWHVLLASLALQPWGWRAFVTNRGTEETVHLCPASRAATMMGDA